MNNDLHRVSMIVWNEFLNDARVLKEAQTLQKNGYQVTVYALHTPGVTKEKETLPYGVKVVRVSRSPFLRWRRACRSSHESKVVNSSGYTKRWSFKKIVFRIIARSLTHTGLFYQLIKSRPVVIHAHDVNTLPTAWLASKITRSKLVYDAHEISTDREGYASVRKLVGWMEKKITPRVDGMITTTDIRARFFSLAYQIPRPLVLQNRPRFSEELQTDKIRNQLNLTENWPIVLYQGGLQQGRGLERIVDAANKIKGAYFVFIGGGRLEGALKEKVEQFHISERVKFIDTVKLNELPSYTASANIGLQVIENTCLNHYSTDSNKLFEYVMAGLPIVATDMPEIKSIVHKNDIGVIIPDLNTDALIKAIEMLIADESLRKRFIRNSKNVRLSLSWETQEMVLVELYNDILENND